MTENYLWVFVTDLSNGEIVTHICDMFLIFFFFQAEDGIRDIGVTGVQTCALPISFVEGFAHAGAVLGVDGVEPRRLLAEEAVRRDAPDALEGRTHVGQEGRGGLAEIGRASCRERV